MISVKDNMKLNTGATVLVCDMFEDKVVTDTLKSNIGIHRNFEVEKAKCCFGIAQTRNIVIFDDLGAGKIEQVSFS